MERLLDADPTRPELKMKATNVRAMPVVESQDPATFTRFQFVGKKAEVLAQFGTIVPQQIICVSDLVAAALEQNDPGNYRRVPTAADPPPALPAPPAARSGRPT
jgi:hypothetical protein